MKLKISQSARLALIVAVIAIEYALPSRLNASETWQAISTVHFNVRYRQGMEDLGVLTADLSEEAYILISNFIEHDMTRTVSIDVWPAHQGPEFTNHDYMKTHFRNGLRLLNNNRINITYPGSIPAYRSSLTYMIAHAFQYDIFADEQVAFPDIRAMHMPDWFTEAMAVYISGLSAKRSAMYGRDIITSVFPGCYSMTGFTGFSMFDSPREGPDFIGFLNTSFGRSTLGEIIRDVRDTGRFTDAVGLATGKTFSMLEDGALNYFKRNSIDEKLKREHVADSAVINGSEQDGRAFNILPAISPDGTRIAYLAAGLRSPVLRVASIERLQGGDTGGISVTSITDIQTGRGSMCALDNRINWTSDGRTVMLAGRLNSAEAILFVDTWTGRIVSDLRLPFSAVMYPSLSRNEKYVVFSGVATVSADIYIYTRADGSITRLTDDAFMDRDPVMTPDGTSIIFATNCNTNGILGSDSYDIIRQDVKTGIREVLVSSGYVNVQPVVSQDGKKILYVSDEKGRFNLYTLDLKSRKTQQMTDSQSGSLYPAWFPSGNGISYVRNVKRGSDIIIKSLDYSGSLK